MSSGSWRRNSAAGDRLCGPRLNSAFAATIMLHRAFNGKL
jgi:hypothetical protein